MSSEGSTAGDQSIEALFMQRFGAMPAAVASAPGRVNLMGDHTDYAGGVVMPMALAERTTVAIGPASGGHTVIDSITLGRRATCGSAANFERRPSDDAEAWINLVMGPLRLLRERGLAEASGSLNMLIASEVPIGAGLSSSAAMATATALAALTMDGRAHPATHASRRALIHLIRDAEEHFAGTPCGIMDMTVALMGREGVALLLDCATEEAEEIGVPPDLSLHLVDSGVRHQLSDGGYAQRRAEVDAARVRLGVPLRQEAVPPGAIEALAQSDARLASRARHVISENERVHRLASALQAHDLDSIGEIVRASHASLRDDAEISIPALDAIVARVESEGGAHGALGARVTGGGFGGSVLVFGRSSRRAEVEAFLNQGIRLGIGRRVIGVHPPRR
ncbi:MAG: hypothetical protein KF724_01750 [Phycisphaeraceae bacterium]|nr:hypothetical protein [Phycisphaeraceae bacterium]